jgi:hypothetical protein
METSNLELQVPGVPRLLVASLVVLAGCVSDNDWPQDPSSEAFTEAMGDLDGEFGGDGKADLFDDLVPDPCELLHPIFVHGDAMSRAGFFMGVEGDGVLGVSESFGGYDIVWDLYHQQMTVSRYGGYGVATPGIGASIEPYVGFAAGFEHGVSDWDGYFVTTEIHFGLPFLDDFVGIQTSLFVTGVDADDDGIIGTSEMLLPPEGVYGFGVGVTFGFELLPDIVPIEGSITEGYWQPYPWALRAFYDRLAATRFFWVGNRLTVQLVDHHTGQPCHPDWPEVDAHQDCVIQFGDPEWSYTRNATHVAYSICELSGSCAIPLSWPVAGTAIAIGAFRDFGGSFAEMCPDHLGGSGH